MDRDRLERAVLAGDADPIRHVEESEVDAGTFREARAYNERVPGIVVAAVREETGVEATITEPLLVTEFLTRHGDRSTWGYLVLFAGVADDPTTAADPGLDDESIETVAWRDSVPAPTPDDETIQRGLAVVADRFDLRG